MKATQAERFWAKVDRRGPDDCWPWTASLDGQKRYGQFRTGGRESPPRHAHRYALYMVTGIELTPDQVVRHSCDNPPCCNPAHLIVGTQAENLREMFAKGRNRTTPQRGEANYGHKLSDQKVRAIRRRVAAGETRASLAREYGVSQRLVGQVVRRTAWAHVA